MDRAAMTNAAIVQGMALLVRVAGQEWILSNLMPRTVGIYNQYSSSYLVRITIIQTHVEVAMETKSGPLWREAVAQVLHGLTQDKVANVRMVSAKGLIRIVPEGESDYVQAQVLPALEMRAHDDPDVDCRNACARALDRIK